MLSKSFFGKAPDAEIRPLPGTFSIGRTMAFPANKNRTVQRSLRVINLQIESNIAEGRHVLSGKALHVGPGKPRWNASARAVPWESLATISGGDRAQSRPARSKTEMMRRLRRGFEVGAWPTSSANLHSHSCPTYPTEEFLGNGKGEVVFLRSLGPARKLTPLARNLWLTVSLTANALS